MLDHELEIAWTLRIWKSVRDLMLYSKDMIFPIEGCVKQFMTLSIKLYR